MKYCEQRLLVTDDDELLCSDLHDFFGTGVWADLAFFFFFLI